jgi:hypothetical protein
MSTFNCQIYGFHTIIRIANDHVLNVILGSDSMKKHAHADPAINTLPLEQWRCHAWLSISSIEVDIQASPL